MKIATNSFGYPHLRNFVEPGRAFATYVRAVDLFAFIYWMYARLLPRALRRAAVANVLTNLYLSGGLERARLRHFFNTLAIWSGPWVVTYEAELPRWSSVSSRRDWRSRLGLRLLASSSCRAVIAISRNAMEVQLYRMELDPHIATRITPKIRILHPPQAAKISRWEDKGVGLKGRIRFVMVGRSFFMKGGREILAVFDELLRAGQPLQLHIVSPLDTDDWATCTTDEDVAWARAVMARHADAMRHSASLSNQEVMQLFLDSHVGLLPSYAETYGYSVLEAQACGCPAITTDVGAMPEINNDQVGWLIPVPKRDYGNGRTLGRSCYHTPEGRSAVSRAIASGLRRAVLEILGQRDLIRQRGEAALNRIVSDHDPDRHSEKLRKIYLDALSESTWTEASPSHPVLEA